MTAQLIQPIELLAAAQSAAESDGADDAQLRRAVSTAYYALFHELVSRATRELWDTPATDRRRIKASRWFAHGDLMTLAAAVSGSAQGSVQKSIASVLGQPSPELITLANIFTFLQGRAQRSRLQPRL